MLNFMNRELTPGFLVNLLSIIGNFMEKHPPFLSEHAFTFNAIKRKKLLLWKGHQYGVLENYLLTKDRRVHLAPPPIMKELEGALDELTRERGLNPRDDGVFLLIGRRHLKTMNSWMHNVPALWKKRDYPDLLINTADADVLDIRDGAKVTVSNALGRITVPVKVTGDIMQGVVCYPHGWGHDIHSLGFAIQHPGANHNVLTASDDLEWLSGMPRFNGTKVWIEPEDG